jgi:hypothetical protein
MTDTGSILHSWFDRLAQRIDEVRWRPAYRPVTPGA